MTSSRPDASRGTRESLASRATAAALFLVVGVVGVCNAFYPTLSSGFARIQADVGDPLLSTYFLEHELSVLRRPGYVGTLWSPPFFFPARGVLAYSENMFGMLPFYALLRLGCSPTLAYQVMVILLLVLCYASMLWLLRSLRVRPLLAALGASLYAFGLPREAQVAHLQLLPAFYCPLVLLALRRLLDAPGRGSLLLLLGLLYLQLLSSIYLSWSLCLGLALLLPLWLAHGRPAGRPAGRRLAGFCRRRPLFSSLSVVSWLALSFVTLRPYLRSGRELGYTPWETIQRYLPTLKTWFTVPDGSLYARLLPIYPPKAPLAWERYLFPGFAFLGLALVATAYLLFARREADDADDAGDADGETPIDRPLLLACWSATVVLVLVSLVVPQLAVAGWRVHRAYPAVTLWWYVFRYVPGGAAFRAASRVWTVIYLLGIVAAMGGAEAALRRTRPTPWVGRLALALLLGLSLLEQHVSNLSSQDKQPFLDQVERIRAQIHPGCSALYATVSRDQPFYVSQLTAMWAGLEANVPTVNGYSSKSPPHYPSLTRTMNPEVLGRWAGVPVCVVTVPRAGSALAAPGGEAAAAPNPHRP